MIQTPIEQVYYTASNHVANLTSIGNVSSDIGSNVPVNSNEAGAKTDTTEKPTVIATTSSPTSATSSPTSATASPTSATSSPTSSSTETAVTKQDDSPAPTNSTLPEGSTTEEFYKSRSIGEPKDFSHIPKAAIVTKIHGDEFLANLFWSFCLLDSAYNSRVQHDIFIFHTEPLNENRTLEFQSMMAPAKVTFVLDELTFQGQLDSMTQQQRDDLVERCDGADKAADLTWRHRCQDGPTKMPLAYCWMAEFRSRFLWNHTVLQDYRYMMWVDTDALCMKKWEQDPIAFMARNNLVLLQGNDGGNTRGWTGVQHRIFGVYNKTLCGMQMDQNTKTYRPVYGGGGCLDRGVLQTHGYFHVIDLDFYRLPINLEWSNAMMNGTRFSRLWDDQLAVKVPAAMLAPDRMMDMVQSGLNLGVMHHGRVMQGKLYPGRYTVYWRKEAGEQFPDAKVKCRAYAK